MGVLLGVFVAVLYLACIFLIIHRSVDMKINALIETKEIERPMATQKVGPEKEPEFDPALWARIPGNHSQDTEESVSETNIGQPSEKTNEELSPRAVVDLSEVLGKVNRRSSRALAMKAAIDLWSGTTENISLLNDMEDDQIFFRVAARQSGLSIQRVEADLELVRRLNVPVVMEFYLEGGGTPRYLTLAKILGEDVILLSGIRGKGIQLDAEQVSSYWSGVAFVLWKDFLNLPVTLSPQNSGDAVLTLKMFMHDLGYKDIDITPTYDEKTMKTVKQIQRKHGIRTDGVVGPLTKIALYNEKVSPNTPRLVE
jgi:general secretion pathway protein A